MTPIVKLSMIKMAGPGRLLGGLLSTADDLARGVKAFAPRAAPRSAATPRPAGNPFVRPAATPPPLPKAAPPIPASPAPKGNLFSRAADLLARRGPSVIYPAAIGGAALQGYQASKGMFDHMTGVLEGRSDGAAQTLHQLSNLPWWQRLGFAMAPQTVMDSTAVHKAILENIAGAKERSTRWFGPGVFARTLDRLRSLRADPEKGMYVPLPSADSYLEATANMYETQLMQQAQRSKAEMLNQLAKLVGSGELKGVEATGVPADALAQAR